jgi:DNA-binding NarL/FixJ family response regulator
MVRAVRESPLPVALLDLATFRFIAMSASEAALLGIDLECASNRDILEFSGDPEHVRSALTTMTSGGVDAYEAHRRVRRPDGTRVEAYSLVRRLVLPDIPDRALQMFSAFRFESASLDQIFRDADVTDLAVGTTDGDLQIDRMSRDVEDLLGYPHEHWVGSDLIDLALPEDAKRLTAAIEQAMADRASVELTVRLGRADGGHRDGRMVVSAELHGSPVRLGFSLAGVEPEYASAERRAAQLEAALGRIATEMRAVGITPAMAQLPAGASLPELADLSTRQWEIVTRLVRGDRVPSIARSMFLSQNTVRNYLAAVYRKLGVHSQQELIERLRGDRDDPSG